MQPPSSFQAALAEHYPSPVEEAELLRRTSEVLSGVGFHGDNSMACVCSCRDELSQTLHARVTDHWGLVFNKSSLAGMVSSGKTGFAAALAHSPLDRDGRERYVFFAMPHVGIGPRGEAGVVVRPGRSDLSPACGALLAFRAELVAGDAGETFDPDDVELSLLRRKLVPRLSGGEPPDVHALTRLVHDVILDDLTRTLDATFDAARADLAVLTGIQIHAPGGVNYVQPMVAYTVVSGERRELELEQAVD